MPSRAVRIVAWGVGAAVVAGGACVAYESLDARATRADAAVAWRDYGTCLLGEPLVAGDLAADRLRAIDLGLLVADETRRGEWPGRCGRYARELADLLDGAARHESRWSAAAQSARLAAAQLDPGRVDPATVDALSTALAALPLPRAETSTFTGPPPPPPMRAELARSSLVELGRPGPASLVAIDPPAGARPAFAFGGHPARLCDVDPGLASVRCFDAPHAADDAQVIPVPSASGATSALRVLLTHDTPAGIVRADDHGGAERVADDWNAPAFVRGDGLVWTLAPSRASVALRRGADDVGIAITGTPVASALAADAVVWVDAAHRLHARDLDADGSMGSVADIGPLPPGEHAISLCRATDGAHGARPVLVVRVTTGDQAVTSFHVDRGWSTPVASPRADRPAALSCHDTRVALTWLDGGAVHRIACTPAGCARTDATLGAAWSGGEANLTVADVAGRVLVARLASSASVTGPEPVQAVVARFAPLEALAAAPDRVLVADAAHGGVDPASVQAFARNDGALLVVTARDGTAWAARLGADGELGAITPSGGR